MRRRLAFIKEEDAYGNSEGRIVGGSFFFFFFFMLVSCCVLTVEDPTPRNVVCRWYMSFSLFIFTFIAHETIRYGVGTVALRC